MPFTPFYWGPALLVGLAISFAFDLPTLLIASVAPDVEPFYVMYFHVSGYPLHGFFHSYLGASILAFLVAIAVYPLRSLLSRLMTAFRMPQKSSFQKILFTSFVGVYSHVFLDSFLYEEMVPFYPLQGNPFLNMLSPYVVYGFCDVSFILDVIAYLIKVCASVQGRNFKKAATNEKV
jgi:membrane-bound metal-dependent hydrolase YbcI (DUF457 family)